VEVDLPSIETVKMGLKVRIAHMAEKWGFKEGRRLVYPFPVGKAKTVYFGTMPQVGQGYPVLFINIAWLTSVEVWEPIIREALNVSPSLHIVLLFSLREPHEQELKRLQEMLKHFPSPRISAIAGVWVSFVFGKTSGILAFLCDGNGFVRAVESYPELNFPTSLEDFKKDWQPKLHQAVKKVLDEFFQKSQGR
ncbi:MAG: hypothetical protein RMK94_16310, partial [Armatimonadota bacterium]|nr:hypothetical protein [Armatimonadota bacterium]